MKHSSSLYDDGDRKYSSQVPVEEEEDNNINAALTPSKRRKRRRKRRRTKPMSQHDDHDSGNRAVLMEQSFTHYIGSTNRYDVDDDEEEQMEIMNEESDSDGGGDIIMYGHSRAFPVMEVARGGAEWQDMLQRDWTTHPPNTPEEYLLRVRLEATHKLRRVVVAQNVDARQLDEGRRSAKLVDRFQEHRSHPAIATEEEKCVCLQRFSALKETLCLEMERWRRDPLNEKYALGEDVARAMPKRQSDWKQWRQFCLGRVTPVDPGHDLSAATTATTAAGSGGGSGTTAPVQYENEEKIDIFLGADGGDGDDTDNAGQVAETQPVALASRANSMKVFEPSLPVLVRLDHVTVHGLFHHMTGWTVANTTTDRQCFLWLHSLFLLLETPLPARAASDMNDLFLWCLRRRRALLSADRSKSSSDLQQLNAILTIVVGHFKQGDASLV